MSFTTSTNSLSSLSKLEELAFLAIYRSVVDCLLQDGFNRKQKLAAPFNSIRNSDTNKSVSEAEGIERVRQLARQLLEKKCEEKEASSKDTRVRLLKHFIQEKESNELLLSSFLNVVLDETVEEITAAFDHDNLDQSILPTIVQRCPNVKTLHLHCQYLIPALHDLFVLSIQKLTCLSSLNLYKIPPQCYSIIHCLGKACPNLRCLRIAMVNHVLSTHDFLRIFYAGDLDHLDATAPTLHMNERTKNEEANDVQKGYHRCQVDSQEMQPFCRTLEEVRINNFESEDPYVIGFILRHLPSLRELEMSDYEFRDHSASIRALWDIWECESPPGAIRLLETQPTERATRLNFCSDLIVLANFTGTLSLTTIFLEGEKDFLTLKSICDLCPRLKKLEILETSIISTNETNVGGGAQFGLSEVQANFNKLSQLSEFTCEESDGPLCVTITQATAPYLTTLEMTLDGVGCPKLDFLIGCVNLRILKLSTEFHPPLKSYFDCSVNPSSFLPLLEEVQLEFCMNAELEELFLKKTTLKSIDVLCMHHLGQTEEEILDLFLQWPQLVNFKYKMPRKFTVEMWMNLLTHLPHLRTLSLYKDIKYRCSADFHQLKRACRQRDIKLELHLFLDTYLCIEGELDDELNSTSDESSTD